MLIRYRNLSILLVVVVAQLLYLGYQVKTTRDDRLIRVWAVTAVMPVSGIVEAVRRNTIGFLEDYFILLDVREQNRKLHAENDQLRMVNIYYRNQLQSATNARALSLFQTQTPSKTVAARVVGNSTVATAKAVFIDRGSSSGIVKGMAVVTPDGIVGKVTAVYPLVSQVLLVTDATFKVGVESQKGHVHGVLNCGTGKCSIEQVQNEDKVEAGEWFYTSGEDRLFPRGFPVGKVVSAQPGQGEKDIRINLSGAPGGVEEVLVVTEGVHNQIPTKPFDEGLIAMMPLPPPDEEEIIKKVSTATDKANPDAPPKPQTEADRIREKYSDLGKEQGHVYGGYGSNLPNFNAKPPATAVEKNKSSAQGETKSVAAPAAKTAAPSPPVVAPKQPAGPLGSRPGSNAPQVKSPPPASRPEPALPLGAPRHRPASPSAKQQPEP